MVIERPITGFNGWGGEARKPLSRATLFTIGAVALVHVAGAAYLYYMRMAAPTPSSVSMVMVGRSHARSATRSPGGPLRTIAASIEATFSRMAGSRTR